MNWMPGWGSIDTSTRLHDFFEIAGIVILFLLVLAEIMAYVYGHRRDELVLVSERDAATQREQERTAAQILRDSETAKIQAELAAAKKSAAAAISNADKAVAHQAQRQLTAEQKKQLIAAILPFQGQKISIVTVMGDADGMRFAADFVNVFRSAGWNDGGGTGINQAIYGGSNPIGVEIVLAGNDPTNPPPVPQAIHVFIEKLVQLGIIPNKAARLDPNGIPGEIKISIGIKAALIN